MSLFDLLAVISKDVPLKIICNEKTWTLETLPLFYIRNDVQFVELINDVLEIYIFENDTWIEFQDEAGNIFSYWSIDGTIDPDMIYAESTILA